MTTRLLLSAFLLLSAAPLPAQTVPGLLNYQGRVAVDGTNFTGTGQFRFALVNSNGTATFWSNDGTSTNGSEPTGAVPLAVQGGLYSILLGDTGLTNMTAVPAAVFTNNNVRLRVWFDDGTNSSQLLTPDQRLAAVGYAQMATTVPDKAITSSKIASSAVTEAKIASSAVTEAKIAASAVTAVKIASNAVTEAKIADNAVTEFKIATNAVTTEKLAPGVMGQALTVSTNFTASGNTRYVVPPNNTVAAALPTNSVVGDVIEIATGTSATWVAGQLTPRESSRDWRAIASSADGTKLVATGLSVQIYTSTDGGETWTARESNRSWQAVASSADGTKLVAVVGGGQIYTSTDSGVIWTARESSRNWKAVASSADGFKLVAVVEGGQIYTSTNSGATWTARESNRGWKSVASSADGTKLVAVVEGGQI